MHHQGEGGHSRQGLGGGGLKGGTRLVLSLKGERDLPPEFNVERKKQKALIKRREATAKPCKIGESYLIKKVH